MSEKEKELDDMPIWQNHEQRITALEINMNGLSDKMDRVETTIKEGNDEQKEKLDMINNRMVDEWFKKKKMNLSNVWKFLIAIFGGGGFFYLLLEKFL